MLETLVVRSRIGENFAFSHVADRQVFPLPQSEDVLYIDILNGVLNALSGVGFDYKIHELKNTFDDLMPQFENPLTENFEKLTIEAGDVLAKCRAELISQDASCSVARQKQLADDALDALSRLNNERRNISVSTEFSHHKFKRSLEGINNSQAVTHESEINTGTSYADLWAKISEAILRVKSEYIDFYAGLMKNFLDMYQSYNVNLQKASSESLSAGEDGNSVKFNKAIMSDGYKNFNYFLNTTDLGKVKDWGKMSVEEQKNMKVTLDPAFEISDDGAIYFNMVQYSSIKGKYPKEENGQVSVTIYNSWLVRFNGVGSALQSNMQSFSSRYSQANSTYDTLNKVFSETINRMGNNALDFLKP